MNTVSATRAGWPLSPYAWLWTVSYEDGSQAWGYSRTKRGALHTAHRFSMDPPRLIPESPS